jgi:hypothetical protein
MEAGQVRTARIGRLTGRLLAAVVLVGAGLAASASAAGAAPETIDQYLGAAGPAGPGAPWAMISLGDFTANGPGTDNGNVAVASGSATLNNPFAINGKVYLGQGVSYSSNITPTGGVVNDPSLVSQAASAADMASSDFSALTPTQTVGMLGNDSTITASGSDNFNVVAATGVGITDGTLTLAGNSSSVFVINVSGDFSVGNGGIVLDGVQADNVVWNISGNLTITGGGGGGATFYGTALDVNGTVTVHDDTWNGEIIGGTITDTSGFTVNSFPQVVTQTIQGEIYECVNGRPTTTLASGGTISVPGLSLSSPNPLPPTEVPAGSGAMDATSPSGYHFVACTQTGVTITNHGTKASQTVTVPPGGAGNGIFYVTKHVPPPPKTGYIEICKQAQGTGLDHDVFTFSVQGKTVRVPVGACSPSLKVTSGNVTVTEVSRAGSTLVAVATIPVNRLISDNLPARTAVVKVVPGGVSRETIVTFTNKVKPGTGLVKVCQVAGSGVSVGTNFMFTVGTTPVTVPAGPEPGGYCEIVGKFPFGDQTITQSIPAGDAVSSIVTAPARRQVSKNLKAGTVTIDVGSGVTEVTYTDTRSS